MRLRKLGGMRSELEAEPLLVDSAERNLQVAIEALLDIGSHIIAAKGWSLPSTYAEIGEILGRHGVLKGDLAARLSALAGLRNVLVHLYSEVDRERILMFLDRVDELEELASRMLEYVEAEGIDP
ncbi:MAG: DUF86 domain-containing protein [Candidatus Korarchaeota archaeon]|nr:DUF86 domain-containing protein [Candidatus Korarchaeota archaeon]